MGKSKGNGGGIKTPHIPILPDFNIYNQGVFQPLGAFGGQEMMGLSNLANWATDIATGGNVQTGGALPSNGLLAGGQSKFFAPFTAGGAQYGAPGTQSFLGGTNPELLGPFLSNAVQNLMNAQGSTGFLANLLPGLGQTAAADTAKGQSMLQKATTGSGLYPSQQAMINQAVEAQQQQVTQQLSKEGLSNSTLVGSLTGQVKMSGAAAAGQLVQSNIALAQQEQQIGLDATQISVQAQQALFNQFSNIASMSATLQNQVWNQALQGYGAMGQMLNNTVNAFGYGLRTQEDIQNAAIQQANVAVGAANVNASLAGQQATASASMFNGLGQLLGMGQSSGGSGLFGGLGGLLGGGAGGLGASGFLGTSAGAAGLSTGAWEGAVGSALGSTGAVGGAAGGLGGLLGSVGGALGGLGSGIGAAIGVLFSSSCTAGRGLKGVNDIRWVLFRDWILYRSPRLIRTLYARHSELINKAISERAWLRNMVLFLIDQVVTHDQNTRAA